MECNSQHQILITIIIAGKHWSTDFLFFLRFFRPRSFGANGKIKFEDDEKEFCESMDELSCAAKDGTGFWYNSCSAVNLNGRIFKSNDDNLKNKDGMIWVKVFI